MSQFAAGCAICGYDLGAARADAAVRGPSLGERASALRPGWLGPSTSRHDLIVVGLTVVLVVFFPLIGLAVAGWTAYDRDRNGDHRMRNIAIALIAIAIVLLALPDLRFGILSVLTG